MFVWNVTWSDGCYQGMALLLSCLTFGNVSDLFIWINLLSWIFGLSESVTHSRITSVTWGTNKCLNQNVSVTWSFAQWSHVNWHLLTTFWYTSTSVQTCSCMAESNETLLLVIVLLLNSCWVDEFWQIGLQKQWVFENPFSGQMKQSWDWKARLRLLSYSKLALM